MSSPDLSTSRALGESLRAMFELVKRVTKTLAEARGVTLQQMVALYTVYDLKRCTMSALIEHLDVTSGAATGLVDRLVRQGLLTREPGVHDRRQVYLALTPAGTALVEAVNREWEAILERWHGALPEALRGSAVPALSALAAAGAALDLG